MAVEDKWVNEKAYKSGLAVVESGKFDYVAFEYKAGELWHQILVEKPEKADALSYKVRLSSYDSKNIWSPEEIRRLDKVGLLRLLDEKKHLVCYTQSEYVGGEGDLVQAGGHD